MGKALYSVVRRRTTPAAFAATVTIVPKCFWCEEDCPEITRDHVVPQCKGGASGSRRDRSRHSRDLTVFSCARCNQERGLLISTFQQQTMLQKRTTREHIGPCEQHRLIRHVRRHNRKLPALLAEWNRWVKIETEKLGWSATEQYPLFEISYPPNVMNID